MRIVHLHTRKEHCVLTCVVRWIFTGAGFHAGLVTGFVECGVVFLQQNIDARRVVR